VEGDCLEVMKNMKDHSIDMVLCDLPYGQTQNRWDLPIDLETLWKLYERIVKPDGVIALTSHGAFTGKVITSNPKLFKYKIVWIKSKATNFLNANRQPLRKHEDICIFYRKQPLYIPQKTKGSPYHKGLRKDNRSGTYGNFNTMYMKNEDGLRYPTDVAFFEEEIPDWVYFKTEEAKGAYHPTQKPVSLGQWLIRTYTKPGEIVLDNACGSGSFLVAAVLEGRQFIGIEKNHRSFHVGDRPVNFVEISRNRIFKAQATMVK